jgi:hypothetical protein
MKALNIFMVFVLSLLALESVQAQKKIGVFIHGFQGSSEKWTEISEVPQKWKGGVIDDFVALDYKTLELKNSFTITKMVGRFIAKMDSMGKKLTPSGYSRSNDQWIIIGHSLGGIVARRLYPELKKAGYNIVAVVSVGGPSQGAPATEVDTATIRKRLETMKNTFTEAYKYRRSWIELGVLLKDLFSGTDYAERIDAIPDYIETARDSALGYSELVIENNAKSLIGRDGSKIQKINSYSENDIANHPPNFLSVIGAEKNNAPIRMAGQIFEGSEELKDEDGMIDKVDKFRNDYVQRHVNAYERLVDVYYSVHLACRIQHPFRSSICSGAYSELQYARYRRSVWKDVRREIDDLGKTWSELINSFRLVTTTIQTYIPPCDDGGGRLPGAFNIQPIDEYCSQYPGGEYREETFSVKVPDKHDGVVNIHSALWSKNDAFTDDNNRLFDDVPADGGYNHFELRNYARHYTLKENGAVVFSKGSKNPSMEEAENWITNGFRF